MGSEDQEKRERKERGKGGKGGVGEAKEEREREQEQKTLRVECTTKKSSQGSSCKCTLFFYLFEG